MERDRDRSRGDDCVCVWEKDKRFSKSKEDEEKRAELCREMSRAGELLAVNEIQSSYIAIGYCADNTGKDTRGLHIDTSINLYP